MTRYKDTPQYRLPNGRLRQRLPPVRYEIEPQTLELLGCFVPKGYANETQPNPRGENLTKILFLSLWIAYDKYILVGLGV